MELRLGGKELYYEIKIKVMTMSMSMSDEDFIHRVESTGIYLETISTVENLKICPICMHECASESLS